jgi:hypothetical protein
MNALLVVLVITNVAWAVAYFILANRQRRSGHSVHIGGSNMVSIEGYSAKQTARLLELVEETRE